MAEVQPDSAETRALLDGIRHGEARALENLLARYRPELREFIQCQFDPRLRARIGARIRARAPRRGCGRRW